MYFLISLMVFSHISSVHWPYQEPTMPIALLYWVDEKYATVSVHFQNKNFLETPFMNSNFDSSQK